jgi:hypothetical protein
MLGLLWLGVYVLCAHRFSATRRSMKILRKSKRKTYWTNSLLLCYLKRFAVTGHTARSLQPLIQSGYVVQSKLKGDEEQQKHQMTKIIKELVTMAKSSAINRAVSNVRLSTLLRDDEDARDSHASDSRGSGSGIPHNVRPKANDGHNPMHAHGKPNDTNHVTSLSSRRIGGANAEVEMRSKS